MFVLFAAPVFAYDVAIKVTVSQDTLAVGTNVTIVKDGTLLYNTKVGASGIVSFNLDPGSYFVYLDRGGYSRHVNLLEVGSAENITYTMRQIISYASVYGQVTGPTDFSSASVAAYSNGNIAKRATPNKDGYYLMAYLPEGNYDLVFAAPGFVEEDEPITLFASQFSEANVKLGKIPVAPVSQPAITAPSSVQKQSVIEIQVMNGSSPMPGQTVQVKTPAGDIEAVTGADGKAHVNAVAPGKYVFTYGNLTSTTVVEGETVVPVQPVVNDTEPVAPIETAPEQTQESGGLLTWVVAAAMAIVIVVIGIVIFIAGKIAKKQGPKEGAGAHEPSAEPHGHKHAHAHQHKK